MMSLEMFLNISGNALSQNFTEVDATVTLFKNQISGMHNILFTFPILALVLEVYEY